MKQQQLGNTINLLDIRKRVMLVHSSAHKVGNTVMMKAITKEEEEKLDKRNTDHVYFYGDININDDKDLSIIKNYNFVQDNYRCMIYKNFDYNNANFTLVPMYIGKELDYIVKECCTIDPVEWFKYNHCLLGKPDKIVVYNADDRRSNMFD